MTRASWTRIQTFFEAEIPKLVLGRNRKIRPIRPRGTTHRKRTPK
ncbi:MAG TPA: hypothetical protein VM513_27250 [Kofleriaceae bacterium]|jgi:hypothetical protein|nr:hypothetical protein [Kofleriaceae bacterium]